MNLRNFIRRGLGKLRRSFGCRDRLVRRVIANKEARSVSPYLYKDNPKLSLILLSFNHRDNVIPILERLRLTCADELIVCDDGSIDGSDKLWLLHLTRPNEFLIRSNDLHEIRAYNRAVGLAQGEFVCVLQDDDIPPDQGTWVEHALALFSRYPKVGILGGFVGLSLDLVEDKPRSRRIFGFGRAVIPSCDPVLRTPFMFVEGVGSAPVFYRRNVFLALGGLDLDFSGPGESGNLADYELCLRAWLSGWQVGLFGPPTFQRSVGGQGTLLFGRAARERNTMSNFQRIRLAYADKTETINQVVDELNYGLEAEVIREHSL